MSCIHCLWILFILFTFVDVNTVMAQSPCPTIKIPNGSAKLRSSGRLVEFRCKRSFELVGVKFAVCLSAGQWSQKIPTCVGTKCERPIQQPNRVVEELHNGGVLKFSCTTGLTRSGPETLLCVGDKWNDEPPKCIETTETGCDFENEDLCGWSQDTTDDFDWIWNKGETPTSNTGPRFDHTTNSSEGHYLFMESSAPQKNGQKTRIISPPYDPQKMRDTCLEFYYHMSGPNGAEEVGDLDVYVHPQSLTMAQLNMAKNIFHLGGNQGDQWRRAHADIPPLDEPFNFVIQATRLNSWTGDIAIDDVKLIKCLEQSATSAPDKQGSTDESYDTSTLSPTPRRSARRLPTTQQTSTSTTRRKPKQSTTPRMSTPSLAPTKRGTVSTAEIMTSFTTEGRKLPKTTVTNTIPKTSVSDNNIESSTSSNPPSDNKEVNTRQWTSSVIKITSFLSSTLPNFRTTDLNVNKSSAGDNENNDSKIDPDNNEGASNNNNNNGNYNNKNKSGDNKKGTPPSDYIDYTDIDSNRGANRSEGKNDSQAPFVDYDYNNIDSSGTYSNSEADSAVDGLLADAGSVKDEGTSPRTIAFLPLIVGIVASVLVGVTVIALLAWMWIRSQRQKEEKSQDDQMNIITEYVETNLSI